MESVDELEVRIAKDYATKVDLSRLEVKLDSVDGRVASQERTLTLVEYKLNGILGALNKLVWIGLTPILMAITAGAIWAIRVGGGA